MNRTLAVLRICSANWAAAVAWPWGILASAFVINLAIFAVIPESDSGENTTGGLMSIYIVVAVFFLQLFTHFLPFLLGLGVTRKRFFTSVALGAVLQAVIYGIALTALERVESATGGWGEDLRFFGIPFLVVDNPVLQTLVYAGPFLLMAFAGALLGVTHTRWGPRGLYVLTLGTVIAVGAGVFLLTWQEAWRAFGNWFADSSTLALFAGWPVLAAAALAAVSFGIVRRTAA